MSGPFETRWLVVNDVRSPVLIGGPDETASSREAVVFVHGNPGSGSDWEPLMTHIAAFAWVIAPDMPGFGDAERRADQDYTVAGYAAHLAGVLDQLGVDRVHLVAHDFGGPFALTWAAANPDNVASVTSINTGVLINYRWHRLARLWRTPVVGELVQHATSTAVARWGAASRQSGPTRRMGGPARQPPHPQETKRAVLRLYRSTDRKDIEALRDRMRQRNPDTLVVWGADDVYIPVEQAARQRLAFPRARIEILPGVGHWAWLEQPDRVVEPMIPFLRERAGKPANAQPLTTTRRSK